jgi:transposase
MTMIKVKQKKQETISYKDQIINIGLDVHKKNWSVSLYLNDVFIRTFHQESNGQALLQHLQSNYPQGIYKACYEAGFCGFSVQRELRQLGIECCVVNAADIPKTNKGMLSKTDASDSRRIGEAFAKKLLKPIYIPDLETEADRNLIRYRKHVQEELKSKKHKLKSSLFTMGLKIPIEHDKPYWTNNFIKWLEDLPIQNSGNRLTIQLLLEDVLHLRKRLFITNREIRMLSQSDKYKETYILLTSTPGIGLITAMTMIVEIGDINRFDSFTKFNSFIGLCPSEFSSGENVHKGKMTTRSHKAIRSLIIESAWIARRNDPALTFKYHELLKTKTAKRAIVIIARKLLSRLFMVWKTKNEYVKGVLK